MNELVKTHPFYLNDGGFAEAYEDLLSEEHGPFGEQPKDFKLNLEGDIDQGNNFGWSKNKSGKPHGCCFTI